MRKRPIAAPALPIAKPRIACWTGMKPKPNTAKKEADERQKQMRVLLAPLRAALEKAARQ